MQIWGFLPPTFALGPELPNDDMGGLCKDLKLRRISLRVRWKRTQMKILLHEPDNQNLAMSDFLALEPVINDSKWRKFPMVSRRAGQWPEKHDGIYQSTGLPGSHRSSEGGSTVYVRIFVVNIFSEVYSLQAQTFKLLLPENAFVWAKIYFKPNKLNSTIIGTV